MKNISLLILSLFLFSCPRLSLLAQNHDHIWYYGRYDLFADPPQGGKLDFNFAPPRAMPTDRPVELNAYAHIMADSAGTQVLYFSDGYDIYNSDNEVMLNGDTINEGYWIGEGEPDVFTYSGLSVSYPNHDDHYLYFHHAVENEAERIVRNNLYFSQIDMEQDGGRGAVVVKDSLVWDGQFAGFGLTKAGNGVDWWMLVVDYNSPVVRTYTIDEMGISLHRMDTLSIEGYFFSSAEARDYSYAGFSPDGTQFLLYDEGEGLIVFDFDRCSGQLGSTFFRPISAMNRTSLAFSPNARFAYINSLEQLLQVDLNTTEQGIVLDTIANWDGGFPSGNPFFANLFGYSQLAPNGKIYITNLSSASFHVVERPNLPGQACGFRQVGFDLPSPNFNSIPHFPNYRLEPLDCD